MTNLQISRRGLFGAAALAVIGIGLNAGAGRAATTRFQVTRTPDEWRKQLGAARYNVLRQAGTERPYSSPLNKEKRRGIFTCAGCALPLYPSTTKFESHTGWPSFFAAIPNAIATKSDSSLFMERTEVHCRRCGGHLGHIFDDGPKPTGKRHCINGLSLNFRAA